MNKNDFFTVLKMTGLILLMAYIFVLSKFDFDVGRVNLFEVLKLFPVVFISLSFCFYLGKIIRK